MAITLAVLLVMLAATWMIANARPQPVKVRRNLTPEEIAALRRQGTDRL